MSVIVGQLFDKGGIVILNLVIRFIFVYTRKNCLFEFESVDQLKISTW